MTHQEPTVVIDPKTTKVNLGILGAIIVASVAAWWQVSGVLRELTDVRSGLGYLTDSVKEVKHTLDRQGDHLRQAAMSAIKQEARLDALEKRVTELERAK